MLRRALLPVLTFALLVAALATPGGAFAASDLNVNVDIGEPGDQFVLKGRIALEPGETAHTLVMVDGPIVIPRGSTVTGDIVSVDGDVRIAGRVQGHVVTIGGQAFVARSAVIEQGIDYGDARPAIAPGARVSGGVEKINVNVGDAFPFLGWFAWWLAVSVSTLALALLALWAAPRAADATFERMREGGWGPAIGVGFVLFLGLPFLAFVALVSLVGVPFGIGLLLALLPLGALGYVTSAWVIGRALVGAPRSRFLALLAGWAILRVIALVPVLGALGFLAGVVFGLGALAWTLLKVRGGGGPRHPQTTPGLGGPESPTAPAI